MPTQTIKLSGWASLRRGPLDCYQCPGCGALTEALFEFGNGARCFDCQRDFPFEDFKSAEKEETFAVCAECERDMALTPFRLGFIGYTCVCDNCVAVPFEDGLVQPQEILKLQWNEGIIKRGVRISETCSVAVGGTSKDWEVLKMLQVLAKKTNGEFRFANDENDALIAFDAKAGIYLGYVLWYEDNDHATLNQLFVVPEQRRKGYAASMVTYWVGNHAKQIAEKFGLESPNEHAIALHLKLGHLRQEGDQIVGVNCFFVSGSRD
jgi:GNAT superfamily N-acetyltransferase